MHAIRHLRATLVAASLGTAALFAADSTAEAQSTRGPIRFGAIVGASLSDFTEFDSFGDLLGEIGGTSFDSRRRTGFQGGLYAQIPLGTHFSLQPEAHFVQKGGGLKIEDQEFGDVSIGWNFGYLEIPLLLRADFGSGKWRPFVTAGPSLALRVTCSVVADLDGFSTSTGCDEDDVFEDPEAPGEEGVADPFKKTDIGAQVGIGLAGTLGGRSAFVQLRYGQSLSTILDQTALGFEPKNRSFGLVFGIGF